MADVFSHLKPCAWMWTQATYFEGDVRGRGWFPMISRLKPGMPWMEKDLTPLYDQTFIEATLSVDKESIAVLGIPPNIMSNLEKARAAHVAKGGCPGCGSLILAAHTGNCYVADDLY